MELTSHMCVWPRNPVSRSQYSLRANISQTVHPMNSMFGSHRIRFSGWGFRLSVDFYLKDLHLLLSRVTLASAGLSCYVWQNLVQVQMDLTPILRMLISNVTHWKTTLQDHLRRTSRSLLSVRAVGVPTCRVVSPEISSGKVPEISGNLFQFFRKFLFRQNFWKFLLKIQYKPPNVYLFTSSLPIGFYSTSVH